MASEGIEAMGAGRHCVFEYLYRDADNFKAWGTLLLKGSLTTAQVDAMRSIFEEGEYFVAEQIGVPPLCKELWKYSGGCTKSDHAWHEFHEARQADENDLIIGAPWGAANDLFEAVMRISRWDESFSLCC